MFYRWMGWKLVSNEASLYYQHIKGTDNIFAESLSRDFNISDQSLKKCFSSILPPQTAASFHTKLPPINISFWILSLEAYSTQPRESPKLLQPISLETGKDGAHLSHTQASRTN